MCGSKLYSLFKFLYGSQFDMETLIWCSSSLVSRGLTISFSRLPALWVVSPDCPSQRYPSEGQHHKVDMTLVSGSRWSLGPVIIQWWAHDERIQRWKYHMSTGSVSDDSVCLTHCHPQTEQFHLLSFLSTAHMSCALWCICYAHHLCYVLFTVIRQ